LKPELKKDWAPTQGAFRQFLSWLDEGVDSRGEKYVAMRRRLAAYFDRRNCLSPDELADETLNRVARRLEEEGAISDTPPARYCYIVARFVFLEYVRRTRHESAKLDERSGELRSPGARSADPDDATSQKLLDFLERCLQQLEARDRELILEYYRGEQRTKIECRRQLAVRLGLTMNAVSIRACRLRDKLEGCVKASLSDG
jgi:DNA-directed RNA polymerase specialized sigma24 family protein